MRLEAPFSLWKVLLMNPTIHVGFISKTSHIYIWIIHLHCNEEVKYHLSEKSIQQHDTDFINKIVYTETTS